MLCRTLAQLRTVLELGVRSVYADFQDPREHRAAVAVARQRKRALPSRRRASRKPGELGLFAATAKQQPDAVLVRNLSGLEYFVARGVPCVADFSLNAANELTVDLLLRRGAQRVTPSFGLNRDQLLTLARHALPQRCWKSYCISTCRCSTWNIACSVPCCRPGRTRPTADDRATITKSGCAIGSGRAPAEGRRRLSQHGIRGAAECSRSRRARWWSWASAVFGSNCWKMRRRTSCGG
ncbi:MAG: hypothetical protein U0992_15650 [Planctomycetaceae bacterium]